MQSGRKRVISTCRQCYLRKQKCNRKEPCNHCTRRGLAHECTYYIPAQKRSRLALGGRPTNPNKHDAAAEEDNTRPDSRSASITNKSNRTTTEDGAIPQQGLLLPQVVQAFGYFEHSEVNTLALMRKLGLNEDRDASSVEMLTTNRAQANTVHGILERMPGRQIIDFLIQWFAAELNWLDQVIYLPWFNEKYQRWWTIHPKLFAVDIEFTVLIARLCSYTAQFLPSPRYNLDEVRGVLLSDLRNICDEIAEKLLSICTTLDSRGSLIRVQHLTLWALKCHTEGRRDLCFQTVGEAIRVTQSIGMHDEQVRSCLGVDDVEKEMGRRTFCTLYVLDNHLSHQLDRASFTTRILGPSDMPRLDFEKRNGATSNQKSFVSLTERILQARLTNFWRAAPNPIRADQYDLLVAEVTYERFCQEFLVMLPPGFKLQQDESPDIHPSGSALHRHVLHIAIYEALSWNLRPLLLLRKPDFELSTEPLHKRVLFNIHKQTLAVVALSTLNCISQLHSLLGGGHTRFPTLIFSSFDAAVLLLHLCLILQFSEQTFSHQKLASSIDPAHDPIRAGISKLSKDTCLQAVRSTLNRLEMLAEVSHAAEVGAKALACLLNTVSEAVSTESSRKPPEDLDLVTNKGQSSSVTHANPAPSVSVDYGNRYNYDSFDLNSVNNDQAMGNNPMTAEDMLNWAPTFTLPVSSSSRNIFSTVSLKQDPVGDGTGWWKEDLY